MERVSKCSQDLLDSELGWGEGGHNIYYTYVFLSVLLIIAFLQGIYGFNPQCDAGGTYIMPLLMRLSLSYYYCCNHDCNHLW